MKTIGAWLSKKGAERKERSEALRERMLEEEAKHRLQVREYEGELFVCFDDQPLLWAGGPEPRHGVDAETRTRDVRMLPQSKRAHLWHTK